MNKVVLIGRLTKDPELRYTAENQTPVAKFTIAVDRAFKRQGQPEADFLQVIVFGKVAENVNKYMKKGRLVGVGGRIQTGSWTDQEGKKHYTTDIVADEVQFLDKGNSSPSESNNEFGSYSDDFHPVDENDDLPF